MYIKCRLGDFTLLKTDYIIRYITATQSIYL
jgi:hypothetical protein